MTNFKDDRCTAKDEPQKNPSDLVAPGVTKDDLKATEKTLQGFRATAEDEWGDVPEWIRVSLYATRRVREDSEHSHPWEEENPLPLVREELAERQAPGHFSKHIREMRKGNAFVLIDEQASPAAGKVNLVMEIAERLNHLQEGMEDE